MSFESDPEKRQRGLEKMAEVYSFEVADGLDDFFGYTVEHLFGDIWQRPGLSMRDRRLMLMGALVAGGGMDGTVGLQIESALTKGDLSADDLREVTIFLTHYLGWPRGAALNSQVETAIHRYEKSRDE